MAEGGILVSHKQVDTNKHVTIMEAAMKSSCTSSDSSVHELVSRSGSGEGSPPLIKKGRRNRTISGSKSEDHMLYTESGKV